MIIHGCSLNKHSGQRGELMLKKRRYLMIGFFITCLILQGCSEDTVAISTPITNKEAIVMLKEIPEKQTNEEPLYLNQFNRQPKEWGENVSGVKTRIKTDEKKIALTFDDCGDDYGNDYDEKLMSVLKEEQIPATLFVNERWIIANEELFLELDSHPLFQIENHGTAHSPLSFNSGVARGIHSTESFEVLLDEVLNIH